MAINTNYYNYYNNYNYSNTLFGTSSASKSSSDSMYELISNSSTYDKYSSSLYGKNIANRVSETVQKFISSAKVTAFDLKATLDKLTGNNATGLSSFNNKTAQSTDKDILSVKSVDSAKATSMLSSSVQINQIASAQKNIGRSLNAKDSARDTGFTTGSQNIKLSVGNKSYTIDFNVSYSDTNRDVQQKIADSVNSKNIGVKASVVYDSATETSSLVLESTATGTDRDGSTLFELSNISGNALELTGIGEVSQYAQNAQYSVNGGAVRTSKTNDVDIGNGVIVTLKSDGSATVNMTKDDSKAIEDVRNMVESFNELLDLAETNRGDRRTNTLYTQLTNITKSYSGTLSRVGLEVTSGGYLRINETKLKDAAENGHLETFMAGDRGKNYGFAGRLTSISDKVDRSTTNYATITAGSINTDEIYFNSYQLARYSSYENTGLLLSMMV